MNLRNELINLRCYIKAEEKEDKKIYLDMILENYESSIKQQLKHLEYEKDQLQNNLELIEIIKKEI